MGFKSTQQTSKFTKDYESLDNIHSLVEELLDSVNINGKKKNMDQQIT